jgi:hypothetical protein
MQKNFSHSAFWLWRLFYIFIHDVFNDALNSSDCVASNEKVINEEWTGKKMCQEAVVAKLMQLFRILLEGLRKTPKSLGQQPVSGPRI